MNQEKLLEFKNLVIESTERIVSDYKNKVSDTYYLYSETNLPKNFSDSEERYPRDPRVSGTIFFFDRSSDYAESKIAAESFGEEYQNWARKCVLFEEDVKIIVEKCFEVEKIMLSVIDNLTKPYSMLVSLYDSDLISGKIKDKNVAKTIRDKLFGFSVEGRIEDLVKNFRGNMSGSINSIFERGGSYGYEKTFGADRASKYKNKQDYINSLDSMTLELKEILLEESNEDKALSLCGFESKEEFAESIVYYANEIFPIIKFESSNFSDSYTFDYKYKYIFRNELRGFGLFSAPIIIDGKQLKEVCSDFKKSRHVSISASHEDVFGAIERSHKSDPSIPLHEDHFEEDFPDRKSFGHNFNLIYSEENISNLDFDSDDEEKLKAAEKFNSQIEKITDSILDKAIVHKGEYPRLSEKWDYHVEHHNLGSSYNRSYEHEYDNRYSLVSSLLLQSERRFFKKIKELMREVLEERISKLKSYIEKNVSKKYFFFNEILSEEKILKSIEDSFLKDNPQKNSYGSVTSKSTIDNIFGSENVVGYSSNYYIEKLFLVNFESYLEDKIKESILSGNHKISLKEEVDSFDSEISNSLDSLSLKFLKAQKVYSSDGNFKELSSVSKFAKGLDRVGLSILSFYTYISGASDFEIYKNIMENYNLHRIEKEEFYSFEKTKNNAIETMKLDPIIFPDNAKSLSFAESATLAGNLAHESIIMSQEEISDSLKGNSFFKRNSFYGSSGFKNLKNVSNGYNIGQEDTFVRIQKSDENRKLEFFNLIKNNSTVDIPESYIQNNIFLIIFNAIKDFESQIYVNNGKLTYSFFKGIYDFYHTDNFDSKESSIAKSVVDGYLHFDRREFLEQIFYSTKVPFGEMDDEEKPVFKNIRVSFDRAIKGDSFKVACFSESAIDSIVAWCNMVSTSFGKVEEGLNISVNQVDKKKLIDEIEAISENKITFNYSNNDFCLYRFNDIDNNFIMQNTLEEAPINLKEELNKNSGFVKIIKDENSDYFIENDQFDYFKNKKEFKSRYSKNIVHGVEKNAPSRNVINSLNIQHFVNKFSNEKTKDKIFKNIETFNASMKILIKDFINSEERYFTSESRKFSDFLKFDEYKDLALCTINDSDIQFKDRNYRTEHYIELSLITSNKIIEMFSSSNFGNKLFVFIFILSGKNEYNNSRKLATFLKNIFNKKSSENIFNSFENSSYFESAASPTGYIDNEVLFKASGLVTGSKQDRIIKINNLHNVFHSYAGMPNDRLGLSISRFTDFEFPEQKGSLSDHYPESDSYNAFKGSNVNNIDNLINSKYLNKLNLNIVLEGVRFFYTVRNDFFERQTSRLIVDDAVGGEPKFTLSSYFDKLKENMEKEDFYIFSKPEVFDNLLDFLDFLDIDLKDLTSQQNVLILKRMRKAKAALSIFAEGSIAERFNDMIPENGSKKPELFSFNFSFKLPENPGQVYRFETLKDLDPYHFFVGADTNCCQVLGGVGEAAAIDSYINPYAGVLVLYRNDVLFSQSYFHWQKEDDILILDNVESNYSGFPDLEPAYAALGKYCTEKGLFSKVLCGKGYSSIKTSLFSTSIDRHKPRYFEYEEQYTDYTMGDSMDLSQYKEDISFTLLGSAIDEAKPESLEDLSFDELFDKFKSNFYDFSKMSSKNRRDASVINSKLKSLEDIFKDIENEEGIFLSKYEKVKGLGINKSDLKNFFLSQLSKERDKAQEIILKIQEESALKREAFDNIKNTSYSSDKEAFVKEMEEFFIGSRSKALLSIEREKYKLEKLIEDIEFSGLNFKELEENVGLEKLIQIFKMRRRAAGSAIREINSISEDAINILIILSKNRSYYFETFNQIKISKDEIKKEEKLIEIIDEEMALIDEMIKVSRNIHRKSLIKLARFFLSSNMNSRMIKIASMAY